MVHQEIPATNHYRRTMTEWGDPTSARRALLVHGLSSNSGGWWRVGEALAELGWYVVAPDLRGHGSAARAERYGLSDYAFDLPTGPWHLLVGHSLGGAISTLRGNEIADRIVLLDPVLEVKEDEWDAVRADQLAELTLDPETFDKPHWHPRDVEFKLAAVAAADPAVVAATFDDSERWNLVDEAMQLRVPTLILSGDPSVYTMLDPSTAARICSENPLVQYRVIAGAGHSPQRDRPEETLAAILEFCA
jgi:pimeloyl-ACP methyl ester carboxylesterase